MNVAFAHTSGSHGAADVSLLTSWNFDPTIVPLMVLALLYFRGIRAYRARGGWRFPRWRGWLFGSGLGAAVIALLSPVDALADYSFTWHMAQHQLLILVAVPFLLLGAPFIPVCRGIPVGLRQRWFIPFARNRVVRVLATRATRPIVALIIMQAAIVLWHFPRNYDAALRNEWIHYLEHFCFVFPAILFWWNLVSPYPFPSLVNVWVRMALVVMSSVINTAVGSLVAFSGEVLFSYREVPEFWGLSMLSEQELGGLLMWVGGVMMHLAALTAIFFSHAYEEAKKEPKRAVWLTSR